MVAGAFDCADIIARVRDIKPVWALANDMNCSAGQLAAAPPPASGHADRPDRLHRRHDGSQ
ncbi:hypothetical protein ECZU29_48440 [Escherichia coli]|nr:hypothetical protein ECZU29_48440 [Escherichia coli]